jgi:hypothetical protein
VRGNSETPAENVTYPAVGRWKQSSPGTKNSSAAIHSCNSNYIFILGKRHAPEEMLCPQISAFLARRQIPSLYRIFVDASRELR